MTICENFFSQSGLGDRATAQTVSRGDSCLYPSLGNTEIFTVSPLDSCTSCTFQKLTCFENFHCRVYLSLENSNQNLLRQKSKN